MDVVIDQPRTPEPLSLTLGFGLDFPDLYRRDGLVALDRAFLAALGAADPALCERLEAARADPASLPPKEESALILAVAPRLEQFLAALFGIGTELAALARRHDETAPIYTVKRQFVQRRAAARIAPEDAQAFDGPALERELRKRFGGRFDELTYATQVAAWIKDEAAHATELDLALRYAAWALHTAAGRAHVRRGVLFKTPGRSDPQHLVAHAQAFSLQGARAYRIDPEHLRRRDGFALTDPGTDLVGALDQANYCIWCHEQGKDSCSRGLREKPSPAEPAKITFRKSAAGTTLAGCPLEEKISEFQMLKAAGQPGRRAGGDLHRQSDGRGHRPPDLQRLHEVVHLPEAGSGRHPAGRDAHAQGRAGAALGLRDLQPAHALEPAQPARAAAAPEERPPGAGGGDGPGRVQPRASPDERRPHGGRRSTASRSSRCRRHCRACCPTAAACRSRPIRDAMSLYEALDDRMMAGFGGVAEYGITVRWDKNFLKLIRLLLERRAEFAHVRRRALRRHADARRRASAPAAGLGFDHVALCMGAGRRPCSTSPTGSRAACAPRRTS